MQLILTALRTGDADFLYSTMSTRELHIDRYEVDDEYIFVYSGQNTLHIAIPDCQWYLSPFILDSLRRCDTCNILVSYTRGSVITVCHIGNWLLGGVLNKVGTLLLRGCYEVYDSQTLLEAVYIPIEATQVTPLHW